MIRLVSLTTFALIVAMGSATAQRTRLLPEEEKPPAQWGVTASVTPRWEVPGSFSGLIAATDDAITTPDGASTVTGSEWSIGIVRGRPQGMTASISLTQQRIRAGSEIDGIREYQCTQTSTCRAGTRLTFDDVQALGAEGSLFFPFLRLNDHVGFGLDLGGGGARFMGTASEESLSGAPGEPPQRAQGSIPDVTKRLFYGEPYTWFLHVEPGVAIWPTRNVRIHAGAGFHFPGRTYFSLKTAVFFGRATP